MNFPIPGDNDDSNSVEESKEEIKSPYEVDGSDDPDMNQDALLAQNDSDSFGSIEPPPSTSEKDDPSHQEEHQEEHEVEAAASGEGEEVPLETTLPPDPEPASTSVDEHSAKAPETDKTDSDEAPYGLTPLRRRLMMGLCILIVLILLAQAIVIGLLLRRDDDGDTTQLNLGSGGGGDSGKDSEPPTVTPTSAPALLPTSPPPVIASYFPIRFNPDTQSLSYLSTCDSCQASLPAPIELEISDQSGTLNPVRTIVVSSNGFVDLKCAVGNKLPVCATIDVVFLDLAPTAAESVSNSGIFMLSNDGSGTSTARQSLAPTPKENAVVISWEKIPVAGTPAVGPEEPLPEVNVQVTIDGDSGDVTICFGEGNVYGAKFRTGIWDPILTRYHPAIGPGFDADGYSTEFPAQSCQSFTLQTSALDPPSVSPTSVDTLQPSLFDGTSDSFYELKFTPGSQLLIECYECSQTLELPFAYPSIRGDSSPNFRARTIEVLGSGEILFYCGSRGSVCLSLFVVETSLEPENGGGIYAKYLDDDAIVISYEDVPVCCGGSAFVNAQARIFRSGRIVVCFEDGRLPPDKDARTGLFDILDQILLYPATGPAFDGFKGRTFPGVFPGNNCQEIIEAFAPVVDPPTPQEGFYKKPFQSLVRNRQAQRLQAVSESDDQEITVRLNNPIEWFNDTLETEVVISSNGQIRVGKNCSLAEAEEFCGIIDVAFADLNPSLQGNVYFWDAIGFAKNTTFAIYPTPGNHTSNNLTRHLIRHSHPGRTGRTLQEPPNIWVNGSQLELMYVVSWEDVVFRFQPSASINAQARFYLNGTIELCWGESVGNVSSIAAGIADVRYGNLLPVIGGPFGNSGKTLPGEWPFNLCYQFAIATDELNFNCTDRIYGTSCSFAMRSSDLDGDGYVNELEYVEAINVITSGNFSRWNFGSLPRELIVNYNRFSRYALIDLSDGNFLAQFCCGLQRSLLQVQLPPGSRPPIPQSTRGPVASPTLTPVSRPSLAPVPSIPDCIDVISVDRCSLLLAAADVSRNEHLEEQEYVNLANQLANNAFEIVTGSLDAIPPLLARNFYALARNERINIAGARPGSNQTLSDADPSLLFICCSTSLTLEKLGFPAPFSIDPNPTLAPSLWATVNVPSRAPTPSLSECTATIDQRVCEFTLVASDVSRTGTLDSNAYIRFVNFVSDESIGDSSVFATITLDDLPGLLARNFYRLARNEVISISAANPFLNEDEVDPILLQICCETSIVLESLGYPSIFAEEISYTPPPTSVLDECIPSSSACISDLKDLQSNLRPGATLSICGRVQVSETIAISVSNVTICCQEGSSCTFESQGFQNVVVSAPNVTLRGLTFIGGIADGQAGGNVAIESPGIFLIANCTFVGGIARNGGNLHVSSADIITITDSEFLEGQADYGGGLSVFDSNSIEISRTSFEANIGYSGGGAISIVASIPFEASSTVTILENEFIVNEGFRGGALEMVTRGGALRLQIAGNVFDVNLSEQPGGIASLTLDSPTFAFMIGNTGAENESGDPDGCHDIFFLQVPNTGSGSACRLVDEPIRYSPEGSPIPTVPPTNTIPPSEGSSGSCIATFEALNRKLVEMAPNSTVWICGRLSIETPLRITKPGTSLFCESGEQCTLFSISRNRTLEVLAPNVTLRGIVFYDGFSPKDGGNLYVNSTGNFTIEKCVFYRGVASRGGNVFIDNADDVFIRTSIFEAGTGESGGGLFLQNNQNVTVVESYFEGNRCRFGGGGLVFSSMGSNRTQPVRFSIESCRFDTNTAGTGAAVALLDTDGGPNLKLSITNSFFAGNTADSVGGIGHLAPRSRLETSFLGNSAVDNMATNCSDVSVDAQTRSDCLLVSSNISFVV